MRRQRIRRLLLAVIFLLYVASVPWYRGAAGGGEVPRLLLGLPDWVAVALGCYVAAAVLNAWAWLLSDLRDSPQRAEPGEEPRP